MSRRIRSLTLLAVLRSDHASAVVKPVALTDGWAIGSSSDVAGDGAAISATGYDVSSWQHIASVPSTVLGALEDNGVYSNLYHDENMKDVPVEPFLPTWWYRSEFVLPAAASAISDPEPKYVRLVFKGINYRANVWLNGQQVGSNTTMMGTFRYFDLDVTAVASQRNALAVEVTRPYNGLVGLAEERNLVDSGSSRRRSPSPLDPRCPSGVESACVDLAITWVDWAPTPPDFNMGLTGGVDLEVTGPVSIAFPLATTTVKDDHATVSIGVQVTNWDKDAAQTGHLEGMLGDMALSCPSVTVAAGDSVLVECDKMQVSRSLLWWPWQMGAATLHELSLAFHIDGSSEASDALTTRIGLREVTKEIDERGNSLFRVNGQRILIRGAGWAPDLLLRMEKHRHVQEFEYVKHLGLNAVRLEGKLEDNHLFELADEMGILMLPGWCCCDSWQAWNMWGDEQHLVARESARTQARRLRSYASILVFMYSSDRVPPESVEKVYLKVFEDEKWPAPTLAAASLLGSPSEVSGTTGVKMTGPYAYVPPTYWTDPLGLSDQHGGAFGFNTETSPGAAVMPLESIRRTTPDEKLWPIGEAWAYHCGASTGAFHGLMHFTPALEARLGKAESAEAYAERAQLMSYESHRAMFEAYSAAKYNSTGVVQWMLNNAFPSHVWHLYDWYLNPAGSYFGARKATEPLHIQWHYERSSVWLVNSEYVTAKGPFTATAELWDLEGSLVNSHSATVDEIAADGTQELFAWPLPASKRALLLRLTLTGPESQRGLSAGGNVYWLTPSMDVVDFDDCNFYQCSVSDYADLSALASMAAPELGDTGLNVTVLDEEWSEAAVTLSNVGSPVAFFVRLRLLNADGADVLPVFWSDNYVTLFAGETLTITARFRTVDGPCKSVFVAPYGTDSSTALAAVSV